jgi:amino acid adenylation domain-containing protein
LWFLDQLEPHNPVYNVTSAYKLQGPLDIAVLSQSLSEIVRRHGVLRTNFFLVEGKPVQRIAPSQPAALRVVDLRHLPPSECESEVRRLAKEEARRPFDLERDPLLRSTILRTSSENHVWLLTAHHIVVDGWSLGILFRELSLLYEAFCKSEPAMLDDLPIQYADFAHWQRQWLQGDILETQLAYWKTQLENVATLQLPTDRPRPASQSYRGGRYSIEFSRKLAEGLEALSWQEGATLFMVLSAAFQTLLYRYTGQNDIAVGFPIANRNRAEIEGLIGFFANTLVLRSDLSGNPSFRELLSCVRQTSLEAYDHQELPFEKLVEEMRPERSLSSSPLFQVMFALQNAPRSSLNLRGVTADRLEVENETSKFDLLLNVWQEPQSLRATFQYNVDLFDAGTIERMARHFETLLAGVVADPGCRLSDLPLLTPAERSQLLEAWNESSENLPRDKFVPDWVQEQAADHPELVAVEFGSERLTYGDLNRRAARLARRLRDLAVAPGMTVGICMNRSLEMMIGILAILKAGAAYVPLDPAYPRERLSLMLRDARVSVLLTQAPLSHEFAGICARVLCLDGNWDEGRKYREEEFSSPVTGEDLAYLIYTSGSTGMPKAVAMNHRSLSNLIAWQIKNFASSVPAKTLQFASLSFDVSFQEIFSTWCSGGTLVLVPDDVRRDPATLLRFLREQSIERLFLPYVALQQLGEAAGKETVLPRALREIITAGEPLQITPAIVNFFTNLKDCTLQNQYGPSESHVVTAHALTGAADTWPALPAVGRPIANVHVFILDNSIHPVPVGVPGELHIGGVGLARGYFDRPDLTAEKFIPHPFTTEPGARLYKTGDRARYLPDGNIQLLGRLDDQAKIRGFRIESGEIESALSQHPEVRNSVVRVHEDRPGEKRLIAYVVSANQRAITSTALRSFLKQKLPDHMIPSAFVFLDNFPLTPSGKIDRRALAAPNQRRPELDQAYAAPRSPAEELTAGIWAGLLKLDAVGIHDNFFDLGGHSLLATQLVSRIRDRFQLELPVRAVFEHPTVALMCDYMAALRLVNSGDRQAIEEDVPAAEETRI